MGKNNISVNPLCHLYLVSPGSNTENVEDHLVRKQGVELSQTLFFSERLLNYVCVNSLWFVFPVRKVVLMP